MTEKACTRCGKLQSFEHYHKDKTQKDGHNSRCKSCISALRKERYHKDEVFRDKQRAYSKDRYQSNPDYFSSYRKANFDRYKKYNQKYNEIHRDRVNKTSGEWRKRNPEKVKAYSKKWRDLNPAKTEAYNIERRRKIKHATPSWLTSDHWNEMNYTYSLARELRAITGEVYHVDHIVPLKGESVCGLHVPWNLQVLPMDINIAKGNSYEAEHSTP